MRPGLPLLLLLPVSAPAAAAKYNPEARAQLFNAMALAMAVTAGGLAVALPGAAPDPDVSVVALDFDASLEITDAAALPADSGASGTLADPGKTPR
jgi:hypothetical protein